MKVPRARWSGAAALVLAFGLGGCSGPAVNVTSAGSTSTTGASQSSTSSVGTSTASSSTGEVPVECPAGEVYRCRLDAEGKCGPDSGCLPAVDEYCDPQVCTVSEYLWSADCDFACGVGWDCTPSTDAALLLCQPEIPGECQEGEVYRCRLDAEGECGPGSGCVDKDYCDPLACVGTENSWSPWQGCEGVCGFGWDCSPSDEPSIANCTADPSDEGCDAWGQDCPEGYKCAAWADDGGSSLNATRCVPVVPEPKQVGESCSFPGSPLAGDDDCDLGLMCWNVDYETNTGTCTAFCGGSIDEPTCADGFVCFVALRGVGVALCMALCDPLAQDCPGDEVCLPNWDDWICHLDASGEWGQFGDPCEFANACDPGLACIAADYVPGCMASGCCSPFCDISAPNTCPGVGQVCLPWYEEGTAPRGYENVGVCGLPP